MSKSVPFEKQGVKSEIPIAIASLGYPAISIVTPDWDSTFRFLLEQEQRLKEITNASAVEFYYTHPGLGGIRKPALKEGLIDFGQAREGSDKPGSGASANEPLDDISKHTRTLTQMAARQSLAPEDVVNQTLKQKGLRVFILADCARYLARGNGENVQRDFQVAELCRMLRLCAGTTIRIVFVDATDQFPDEIRSLVRTFDFPLPGLAAVSEILKQAGITEQKAEGKLVQLASNCLGMNGPAIRSLASRIQTEKAARIDDMLSMVKAEKKRIVRNSRSLELVETDLNIEDVGGLENLKGWLNMRRRFYDEPDARNSFEKRLDRPKGLLLVGLPGCGKSLAAKVAGNLFRIPLLRFDVAATFERWVGASEENMRQATSIAEAMAPCVLWIDEIEKAFAGASGGGDGGTGTRSFGHFLTWMQESREPVFIFATANNITALENSNPEFFRYGRFDEKFFVDLPMPEERRVIWKIHAQGRISSFEPNRQLLDELVGRSDKWTGAEIEAAVKDAMVTAFGAGKNRVEPDDLLAACKRILPQAESSAAIEELRRKKKELHFTDASAIADGSR